MNQCDLPVNRYFIASLKHTMSHHEHIVWWGRMWRGYTPVMGDDCGLYVFGEAIDLNDGRSCLAVPAAAVAALQLPDPVRPSGARLYDQRGPVVTNTRANWAAIMAMGLAPGRRHTPKPEVFRGRRASSPMAKANKPEAHHAL